MAVMPRMMESVAARYIVSGGVRGGKRGVGRGRGFTDYGVGLLVEVREGELMGGGGLVCCWGGG